MLLLLIYGVSLQNGFVTWDDELLITENPVSHGLTWPNIKSAFTTFDPELYIPLTLMSFQLNYVLGGLEPFGYHLGSLLLHFVSTLLVAGVVYGIAKNRTAAIVAALLFAVHPVNVETVAWASGRKDAMMTPFFLLSILLYLKAQQDRRMMYIGSIGTFLLALLAKVTVAPLPAILVLIDWYQGKSLWSWKVWVQKIPYFVLSLIFSVAAMFGKSDSSGALFWEKFLIGMRSATLHLWHLVVPWGFSPLYPYTNNISLFTPDIFASVLLVFALTVGCWMGWTRYHVRTPLFVLLWFIALLVPSMMNIAKGHDELLDVYITSDRYAYLPAIAVFMMMGLGYSFLKERFSNFSPLWLTVRRCGDLLLGMIIVILGCLSFFLAQTWYSTETLFNNVLRFYPNSHVAYTNIGSEWEARGQMEKAQLYYEEALKVRPNWTAMYNLGVLKQRQGKRDEAMELYRKAMEASPVEPSGAIALSLLLLEENKYTEVEQILVRAAEDMGHPDSFVYSILGYTLEQQGKTTQAIDAYHKALDVDPMNKDALDALAELE